MVWFYILVLFMAAPAALTAADRFGLTLDGLCRAVAARIAGGAMQAAMILLIWRRLRRIGGQIQGWAGAVSRGAASGSPGSCAKIWQPRPVSRGV
jgi:hypothetical protein